MKTSDIKKKLLSQKTLIYVIVTILILVLWKLVFTVIKWIAIAYLAYRFIKLALEGFSCPTCWTHTLIATAIVIIAFVLSSTLFIVLLIIFLWLDFFFGGSNKKHKA